MNPLLLLLTPLVQMPAGEFVLPGSGAPLTMYVDAFALEKTPVTWAQYKAFAAGSHRWTPEMADYERDFPPDAPMVYVTWDDADAYCQAYDRRLPTELEWEYAAAGGRNQADREPTPEEKAELTWYGGARKDPRPVGQGTPNAYGLYDLHGNVWEWVADIQGNAPRTDGRDPNAGQDNLGCGAVGSNSASYPFYLRSVVRAASRRDHAMRYRGFRCAQ